MMKISITCTGTLQSPGTKAKRCDPSRPGRKMTRRLFVCMFVCACVVDKEYHRVFTNTT